MSLPKITLLYSNGGLLPDVAVQDVPAIVGTVATVGLQGTTKIVYNLDDAVAQGYTEGAEPFMYRHIREFYAELGANYKLYVLGLSDTVTMTSMLDNTNNNGAKKLTTFAEREISLLAVCRKPPGGYSGGANLIDADVNTAITNAKVFAEARLAELAPLRVLIEGRVQNPLAANTLVPKNSTNGFTGVILGGSLNDGSASVGLALGRAVKYGQHIKLGKTANGPVSLLNCYVGTALIKDVANLATLHGDGFISFMQHPGKAGFFFGIDRMCSLDDYRFLAHGRVVDKAARIAAAIYAERIESEVETEAGGVVASHVVIDLEKQIEQAINVQMAEQISEVNAIIAANQNIINTSKLVVKVRVRPLGYSSFIDVELGLTTV